MMEAHNIVGEPQLEMRCILVFDDNFLPDCRYIFTNSVPVLAPFKPPCYNCRTKAEIQTGLGGVVATIQISLRCMMTLTVVHQNISPSNYCAVCMITFNSPSIENPGGNAF